MTKILNLHEHFQCHFSEMTFKEQYCFMKSDSLEICHAQSNITIEECFIAVGDGGVTVTGGNEVCRHENSHSIMIIIIMLYS